MYITQIDYFIDKILDKLYLEFLSKDETFNTLISKKIINFVEYRDKINLSIQNFMNSIDVGPIYQLVQNKENITRIMGIIKRYVAYYYFLNLAYHYTGSIRDFRNNLIQYSKLQETSEFVIRNFFDTENNYQLITYFKIIKDVTNILLMTDFQKKTLDPLMVKDALELLKSLSTEYINNFLLMVIKTKDVGERVVVNSHNLIKTIVFGEIYKNQERKLVFEILNEVEESQNEYTYIDIVVADDEVIDYEILYQFFSSEENGDIISNDLYELIMETTKIPPIVGTDEKNNLLLQLGFVTPIVDDFLRYHRDSEKLDVEKTVIAPSIEKDPGKNIKLVLLYQQRKKKENTRAQMIISKIEAISELYSESVKDNEEIRKNIVKYFYGPLTYRKAVPINYLDEVKVMMKIRNMGKNVIEGNEYYLELVDANSRAYFNFKDFQKYGVSLLLNNPTPIDLIRYVNIEFQNQHKHLEIDMHTGTYDNVVNIVGLAVGPFDGGPIQCIRKENLVDIRGVKIKYIRNGDVITESSENGYEMILKIIKYFYINTITITKDFRLIRNVNEIKKLNSDIFDKVIYWIYDIEKDTYEMKTYENLKSYNFQDVIRFMNAILYDKIADMLIKRLVRLINEFVSMPLKHLVEIIETYVSQYRLPFRQTDKTSLIINEFLRKKKVETETFYSPGRQNFNSSWKDKELTSKTEMPNGIPEFTIKPKKKMFTIKIVMVNPQHPQEYIDRDSYFKNVKVAVNEMGDKCQHEMEWREINKLKNIDLNKYNSAITEFIDKYAIETMEFIFVCRICGQLLPLKQYLQDGSFDNNTQKFISAYTPLDIPLEEVREYKKYTLTIRYLDSLINRFSLITGTNMLVGSTTQIKQKRKALVKNIIDIIVKHNTVNLKKKIGDEERAKFFSEKFKINKNLDSLFFFELDDNIFNFAPSGTSKENDLNRLKFNNILLYFLLIFITELNGPQIIMMTYDKIGNIYTFLTYGPKLFENLMIKANVDGTETVPIVKYQVLCYLIFVISYFLIRYKLWYYPTSKTKNFDPVAQKIIINSFVSLFNSISLDAGRMSDDYVYLLTISKLYSQLGTIFGNDDIIKILKRTHSKYELKKNTEVPMVKKETIKSYFIGKTAKIILPPIKLPTFKISDGVSFDKIGEELYFAINKNTDLTNCPDGSYHKWIVKGTEIFSTTCGVYGGEVTGKIDRTDEVYYYNLNKLANRRCMDCQIHEFKEKNAGCNLCGKKMGEKYTRDELKQFAKTLQELSNQVARKDLEEREIEKKKMEKMELDAEVIVKKIIDNFIRYTGGKEFGQIGIVIDKLLKKMESVIKGNIITNIDQYPVYLRDNVFVIDHVYNGSKLLEPIVITQKENRVMFRENHPFFKVGVYYYTDNRTQTDTFYHAVTLQLLGYKEKYKDYVAIENSENYLKIIPSIQERLLTLGFGTKYIDIGDLFKKNSTGITDVNQNYYSILDAFVRDHVYKIKTIVDKFISILYRMKFLHISGVKLGFEVDENVEKVSSQNVEEISAKLQTNDELTKLVTKYGTIAKKVIMSGKFEEWRLIRNYFAYKKINWEETNIQIPEELRSGNSPKNVFISSELINHYDVTGCIMIYYLVQMLVDTMDNNEEQIVKNNISQMYIEIIMYIYNLYNMDKFKDLIEFKRFLYVLYGSDMMVDILKRGYGIEQSKWLEEHIEDDRPDVTRMTKEEKEELEDLLEEAQALDVESDYFAEEEGDYVEE